VVPYSGDRSKDHLHKFVRENCTKCKGKAAEDEDEVEDDDEEEDEKKEEL